jgi:hypothetical protein
LRRLARLVHSGLVVRTTSSGSYFQSTNRTGLTFFATMAGITKEARFERVGLARA